MRQGALVLGGIATAACLLFAAPAGAATLVGDYQLQGTASSSGPGPALTSLGVGTNTFQTETVMGASRQVLAFPKFNGLRMNPTGITNSTYSVVMTFRFADVTGYARVLDSTNGTAEGGFYVLDGKADYYDSTAIPDHTSPTALFSPNVYATVAITVTNPPGSPLSSIYVNGQPAASGASSFPVLGDTLRFFKDDGTEESAGAVSCIRVYNGVLTGPEIAAIGQSATCGAPASTQPPPPGTATPSRKKCKKHKKKHRSAESAKKKKCNKKKKR